MITYIVINNILKKHSIKAPKLISNHYKNDIIEISDLGEKSFYDFIKKKKNKLGDYKKLIKIIIKLQRIKLKKISLWGIHSIFSKLYSKKSSQRIRFIF